MQHNDLGKPRTPAQFVRLFLTGFAIGAADIVPGVSGGTMAFILGVYNSLLNAITSFNITAIRLAIGLKLRELIAHISLPFLIALGLGIGTAIIALSNLLGTALEESPSFVFAFFGGLVIASIVAIGAKLRWTPVTIAVLIIGAIGAYLIVGLNPMQSADHSPLVLFLSGAIAICAMILPGISGSFILLILGQYQYVLDAVRSRDFGTIIMVGLGAVFGLLAFSRVLRWLLRHHEQPTIAVLTGFMIGSLRKIWEEMTTGWKPEYGTGELVLVVVLVAGGFLLVSVLDHMQSRDNPVFTLFRPAQRGIPSEKGA
jgi:putative membrane protein